MPISVSFSIIGSPLPTCFSKQIAKEEIAFEKDPESMSRKELEKLIADVEKQMRKAAADLDFETAAVLRDKMVELKLNLEEIKGKKK